MINERWRERERWREMREREKESLENSEFLFYLCNDKLSFDKEMIIRNCFDINISVKLFLI